VDCDTMTSGEYRVPSAAVAEDEVAGDGNTVAVCLAVAIRVRGAGVDGQAVSGAAAGAGDPDDVPSAVGIDDWRKVQLLHLPRDRCHAANLVVAHVEVHRPEHPLDAGDAVFDVRRLHGHGGPLPFGTDRGRVRRRRAARP
jgi:hypothetical protein